MKKSIIFLIILAISGCSSNRVQLNPRAINNQKVSYARGGAKFHSQSTLKSELTVLDYSYDEMVIGISITNSTKESILFSEKNVTVNLLVSGEIQATHVYNFEQLAAEAAEKGYKTAALVGNTAAGIGAGFVPFGGIAYSVGRLFFALGSQDEGHQERVDKLTYSQMNQNYLRQQTIVPDETYSGFLKIAFEGILEPENTVIVQIAVGDEIEKFNFICEEAVEKK